MGGALGLLLGLLSAGFLSIIQTAAEVDTALDWRLITFTLALSLLTSVVFGLAPAFRASRSELVSALKDRTAASNRAGRRLGLRKLLIVPQVALSLSVLICAGLCLRSLQKLYAVDVGFKLHEC